MRLIRCVCFLLQSFIVWLFRWNKRSSSCFLHFGWRKWPHPSLVSSSGLSLSLLVDSVVVIQLVPDVSGGTKLENKRVEMKLVRKKKGVAAHSWCLLRPRRRRLPSPAHRMMVSSKLWWMTWMHYDFVSLFIYGIGPIAISFITSSLSGSLYSCIMFYILVEQVNTRRQLMMASGCTRWKLQVCCVCVPAPLAYSVGYVLCANRGLFASAACGGGGSRPGRTCPWLSRFTS